MGLEASVRLLNLMPDASIEDAKQAYDELYEKINKFYQDPDVERSGDLRDDIEMLTCAYETAVAYLSEKDSLYESEMGPSNLMTLIADDTGSSDMQLSASLPAESDQNIHYRKEKDRCHVNSRTVEEAISITSRRMRETESALPSAQRAVVSAKGDLERANQKVDLAKQTNLTTMISAKSAKIRALLLDVEAKKAMKAADIIAERARKKADTARKAADEAKIQADKVREQVIRVKKSEETAAAEEVCAEDRLEMEMARLKALEHKLLETRNCMQMFRETTAAIERQDHELAAYCPDEIHNDPLFVLPTEGSGDEVDREHVLSEMQNIEVFADSYSHKPNSETDVQDHFMEEIGPEGERRRYSRLVYPIDQRPNLTVDNRLIPILDLSSTGMRLETDDKIGKRIVRGSIDFPGQASINIAGRVIRKDEGGLGIKLVTRIGHQVLNRERKRLAA